MNKLLGYLLSPVGCLVLFLLGIGYNVIYDVPAEGIGRLLALSPSVILLIIWIITSSSRNKAGK